MKRIIYFASTIVLVASFAVSSCSVKQKNNEEEVIPMFCIGDTIELTGMIEECLDLIQQKDYEKAFEKFNVVEGDHVYALSEEEKEGLMQLFYSFPILSYENVSMEFTDEHHVDFVYSIKFFEKEEDNPMKNTYNLTISPHRINAKWFLTIRNETIFK